MKKIWIKDEGMKQRKEGNVEEWIRKIVTERKGTDKYKNTEEEKAQKQLNNSFCVSVWPQVLVTADDGCMREAQV
jgi:hypothetical protein